MDIALVYLLLIGFGILVYVLLDGFSLGVGILSPLLKNRDNKAIAMKSLSHIWDSNQTWLVFGGVVLFVGFPIVYFCLLYSFDAADALPTFTLLCPSLFLVLSPYVAHSRLL